jgi:redox-sensitive bicupin YhaK (pirin superfamily)
VLTGAVLVGDAIVAPGHLAYPGLGRDEITLTAAHTPTRVLLMGGVPMDEPALLEWNFVARSRDEIIGGHADWFIRSDRFGKVASARPRIEVRPPPWPQR